MNLNTVMGYRRHIALQESLALRIFARLGRQPTLAPTLFEGRW